MLSCFCVNLITAIVVACDLAQRTLNEHILTYKLNTIIFPH